MKSKDEVLSVLQSNLERLIAAQPAAVEKLEHISSSQLQMMRKGKSFISASSLAELCTVFDVQPEEFFKSK